MRLADLAGVKRRAGRETADEVLRRLGSAISGLLLTTPGSAAARLNGADFALLLPGTETAQPSIDSLLDTLRNLVATGLLDEARVAHIGVTTYQHRETIAN